MLILVSKAKEHRRGIAALFFGVTLPIYVGFVALSVDLGLIGVARCQMSREADAAALAGARQLADDYRLRGITDLTTEIAAANLKASQFAQANLVLGLTPAVTPNASNSSNGQIVAGYLDPNSPSATLDSSVASQSKFNAVQFSATGTVPAYFGKLMGFQGSNQVVRSTAIAQNYSIGGFGSVGSLSANLLPIVLDQPTYQAMMDRTTSDQYSWDPATSTVSSGADGVTESKLYPVASGSPGNWGTIKVGVSNNSTSTLGAQIRYGITPSQLDTFPNSTIALDYTQTPPQITFGGNPGISAGIKDDLESIIGKPVTIPIYDTNGGNGNNAWYRVIAFAGVRIVAVNFQGNPKYVVVQPALVTDPTAIPGTPQASWTSGGLIVLHLAR